MKSRIELKNKAIALRKQGLSYREIVARLNVNKSSLSGWFKLLELSKDEYQALEDRSNLNIGLGRERASLSNRNKRVEREKVVFEEASSLFNKYKHDRFFTLGIGLYWAEGAKRTSAFQFVNSDPEMVIFMIFWIQKYLGFSIESIYLKVSTHEDFRLEKYEDFWSVKTGIPLSRFQKTSYKPNRHGVYKKNPAYKGCVRVEVKGGVKVLRTMLFLQKILVEDIKVLY